LHNYLHSEFVFVGIAWRACDEESSRVRWFPKPVPAARPNPVNFCADAEPDTGKVVKFSATTNKPRVNHASYKSEKQSSEETNIQAVKFRASTQPYGI
jgi:hypothetical protein